MRTTREEEDFARRTTLAEAIKLRDKEQEEIRKIVSKLPNEHTLTRNAAFHNSILRDRRLEAPLNFLASCDGATLRTLMRFAEDADYRAEMLQKFDSNLNSSKNCFPDVFDRLMADIEYMKQDPVEVHDVRLLIRTVMSVSPHGGTQSPGRPSFWHRLRTTASALFR